MHKNGEAAAGEGFREDERHVELEIAASVELEPEAEKAKKEEKVEEKKKTGKINVSLI